MEGLVCPYASIGHSDPSQAQDNKWVHKLHSIIEQRVEADMTRLEKLEVGWFCAYFHDSVLGQDSQKWWITEWIDCLLGGRFWGKAEVLGEFMFLLQTRLYVARRSVMQATGLDLEI